MDDEKRAAEFRFSPGALLGFLGRSLWLTVRGRWHRYGYTCVSFGRPISLRTYLAERDIDLRVLEGDDRTKEIEDLGTTLMRAVGHVVPALPVSLVATAVLDMDGAAPTAFELKARIHDLVAELEDAGAYIHIPRADRDYAFDVGLRMLTLRHLVIDEDGHFSPNPQEIVLLRLLCQRHRPSASEAGPREQRQRPHAERRVFVMEGLCCLRLSGTSKRGA